MQAEVKHVVSTLSGNKYDVIIQTKAVGTSTWTTVLDPRYTPDATHTREYTPATVYDELKAFDTMITVKDDYSTGNASWGPADYRVSAGYRQIRNRGRQSAAGR